MWSHETEWIFAAACNAEQYTSISPYLQNLVVSSIFLFCIFFPEAEVCQDLL